MTNTPQTPPPEPLDEAERSLARALRGLPGGSPPPELDKLVLSAARRAAHMPPERRDRRWIIGLGSAATALLAMGVLLKLHGLGRDAVLAPPASEEVAPAAQTMKPAEAPAASTPMEAAKDAAPASAAGGPAAVGMNTSASGEAGRVQSPPPKEVPPPARIVQAFPASHAAAEKIPPPPPPVVYSTPSPMAAPAPAAPAPATMDERKQAAASEADLQKAKAGNDKDDAARRDAETRQAANAVAVQESLAGTVKQEETKKSAPTDALQANEPAAQRSLDKIEVGGARLKATAPPLPPPADDAKLGVVDWIARIRARLHGGDRAGATSSLKDFMRAHPDVTIPDDLKPLLH